MFTSQQHCDKVHLDVKRKMKLKTFFLLVIMSLTSLLIWRPGILTLKFNEDSNTNYQTGFTQISNSRKFTLRWDATGTKRFVQFCFLPQFLHIWQKTWLNLPYFHFYFSFFTLLKCHNWNLWADNLQLFVGCFQAYKVSTPTLTLPKSSL